MPVSERKSQLLKRIEIQNISILPMVLVSCREAGQGPDGGDKGEAVGKRETRLF